MTELSSEAAPANRLLTIASVMLTTVETRVNAASSPMAAAGRFARSPQHAIRPMTA